MGESTKNLIIEGVMLNHDTPWSNILFIQRCYDNQELKFNLITIHPHPQQQQRHKKTVEKTKRKQLLRGGRDEVIISDGGKKGLKDTYLTSGRTL